VVGEESFFDFLRRSALGDILAKFPIG